MRPYFTIGIVILLTTMLFACTTVDLYEKSVAVPGHEWESSYKPSFEFEIKDTQALYQPFFIIRHTEKYRFTNIYINVYVKGPSEDSARVFRQNLELANNEQGWKGTGMDDVYEHRVELDRPTSLRAGKYSFTVEQIMREDPLDEILNVGIRIEKK